MKIKTTLTKIKYKKEIKSWREKEYRYGLHEGKDRAKKGVTVGKYYLKYYKERRDGEDMYEWYYKSDSTHAGRNGGCEE